MVYCYDTADGADGADDFFRPHDLYVAIKSWGAAATLYQNNRIDFKWQWK